MRNYSFPQSHPLRERIHEQMKTIFLKYIYIYIFNILQSHRKYANVSGKERENRMIPREIKIPNDRQWGIEIEAFFKRIGGGNLVAVSRKVGGFEKVSSFISIQPEISTKCQIGKQLQNT